MMDPGDSIEFIEQLPNIERFSSAPRVRLPHFRTVERTLQRNGNLVKDESKQKRAANTAVAS
mgnify:CR=1 FL=1